MNSNSRGTQTPPRPQARPGTATRRPSAPAKAHPLASVSTGFWLTLAVTVVLLASMLVAMVIMLCIAEEPKTPTNPLDDESKQTTPVEETTKAPTPTKSSKTGISLPSATKAGTYVYDTSTAADMSDYAKLDSQAAALIDLTNSKAVATKNGDVKIYPASMTKVMTVLLACEKATDPTELLTVTEEMIEKYKTLDNPSTAHTWQAGYQVTVEDALYMAIYKSDTYACWLLAEHVAGSEDAFVQMMNQRAAELGCTGTNFKNCTGLFETDHYTTCFDMAAIMAAAMNNAAATKVLTAKDLYTADIYVNGAKNSAVPMWSGWYTGRLEAYPYNGAAPKYVGNNKDIELIAGKTGYETIPTNCFVTAGRNDVTGTLFVCVQVGRISADASSINSKASTDDTREIYQEYANY